MAVRVVDLGALSTRAQLALIRRTSLLVGAHGAGMANIAWCRPGTRILEWLPSDHIQPYHYALAESAGLDYGCLICRSLTERRAGAQGPSWSDFHVDEDELVAAVAAITAP